MLLNDYNDVISIRKHSITIIDAKILNNAFGIQKIEQV